MTGLMGANVVNRTIFTGDNIDVLRGVNSGCVDLIYLDPPFNSNRYYSAPVGSESAGAAFKDTWTRSDEDVAWLAMIGEHSEPLASVVEAAGLVHGPPMQSYLTMMAVRLIELRRVLKPEGAIYLHCDPTAGAYLKVTMDAIFGKDSHRSEIIWHYKGNAGVVKSKWAAKHDVILHYGGESINPVYLPYTAKHAARFRHTDSDGRRFYWNGSKQAGKYKTYMREGVRLGDTWTDIQNLTQGEEYLDYPTQKPLRLLERIIKASSGPGDLVLDPFAGCATACEAAEKLDRGWVGIDLEKKAAELVTYRLRDVLPAIDISVRTDIPIRTDLGKLPKYNCPENKEILYGRQGGHCYLCKCHFEMRNLEVDHRVPQSRGGSDHLDNLGLACGYCNRVKGTGSEAKARAVLLERGLVKV